MPPRPPEMLPGGQFNATPPVLQDGQTAALQLSGGADLVVANRVVTFTSSFTRPNNTTAYTVGQLIANSTVAANVVFPSFQLADKTITKVRIGWRNFYFSGNNSGALGFNGSQVHLFLFAGHTMPTVTNGDGGACDFATGLNQIIGERSGLGVGGFTGGATATGDITSASAGIPVTVDPLTQFWWALRLDSAGPNTPIANQQFFATFELEICK